MTISAKVIAHSRPYWAADDAHDLYTMELTYPRFIHSEFMTHRLFSRNASSSRAIPVHRLIDEIYDNPALPVFWGSNKPGMQAGAELVGGDKDSAIVYWHAALSSARDYTKYLLGCNLHKQLANRIMEPWAHIHVVVTATEWDNFFALRVHPDAQPEIRELAQQIRRAQYNSDPVLLRPGEWHTPYAHPATAGDAALRTSVAGCARVSYNTHDGSERAIHKDCQLYTRLLESQHLSPFEHQGTPMLFYQSGAEEWESGVTHMDRQRMLWSGNFKGWIQYRQTVVQ